MTITDIITLRGCASKNRTNSLCLSQPNGLLFSQQALPLSRGIPGLGPAGSFLPGIIAPLLAQFPTSNLLPPLSLPHASSPPRGPASRAGIAQAAGDALPVRTPVPTWTLPFQWTATPSAMPPPTSTQRPVAEALFTATPTPVPCAETQGAVITASVPSDVLNYPIDAQI